MAIPELDLKKVNLQSAVGYLISLHDNEVDWNLLGIRIVGTQEALPIPAGDYEYGDAYMIGNETDGYKMYIWTRADGEVHPDDYWFPLGRFPVPGPRGQKGDGWETAQLLQEGLTTTLTYDSTTGGKNESISSMTYVDNTTGQRLTKNFQMVSRLPIIPGKYINMDATADNKAIKVKIDETSLGLDFYKINKSSTANVPAYSPTSGIIALPYSYQNNQSSLIRRGAEGEAKFTYGIFGRWNDINSGNFLPFNQIYRQIGSGEGTRYVAKTSTDTGTLTASDLEEFLNMPTLTVNYRDQLYYRMDPTYAPDGTLNYIHIDSIQDGNGGYKAIVKCFSITKSTRAWQMVSLNLARSYTHQICVSNPTTNAKYYFTLVNKKSASYHGNAAGLINALSDTDTEFQPATRYKDGVVSALLYRSTQGYLVAEYGSNNTTEQMTANQIVVWDNVI